MPIDPLSPIAPARIRALLLPVGRIKRSRFMTFVDLLQPECMVRLGDISPDSRPDRNMFSPLAFPAGSLLYELSTSLPSVSQLALSPFEQFREPLLVIGIGDATEYDWLSPPHQTENGLSEVDKSLPEDPDQAAIEMGSALENIKEQFPRVYFHSLMMFDCSRRTPHPWLPEEAVLVPPVAQMKTTTIKTFMCDMTATLLAEMTSLAKSLQALPTIKSPASPPINSAEDGSNWASSESNAAGVGRRNSQIPITSRSDSPVTSAQKDLHRMSMPVQLPSGTSGSTVIYSDSRPTSPTSPGTRTPPPTTFDEIAGVNQSSTLSRADSSTSKPAGSNTNRESSVDRASIQGFGSNSVNERARNKGRGRVGLVIGTLYLCAGRWQDGMKELVESANRARAFSDHLWHAKALENILICLLLFAWSGMDFQIPQICYPIADKGSTFKSPQHTSSASVADVSSTVPQRPTNHRAALQNLSSLIPDLVNMILSIYVRASNFAGEAIPPLAFSECVIRFSKLLTTMYLCGGALDDEALQHLVHGTPILQKTRLSVPKLSINPTRNDIAAMLFRALPNTLEGAGLNPVDRVMVLSGIASVLSSLGLQRKKAIIMKEFVNSLIPSLVQARKVGAAEMGVHPAAGLAALNMASGGSSGAGALNLGEGEVENGIDEFLGLLGRIYGIPDYRSPQINSNGQISNGLNGTSSTTSHGNEAVIESILRMSSLRSFGSLHLKLDILRTCINFCEALPDFQGVLHFTSMILRIAGPGTAPSPNSTDVFVTLPREEQIRLSTNITRTVGAANKLGIQNIETEYWDDFLVRGLHVLDTPSSLRLTQHRPAELKSVASNKEGPFLHNPFLKKPDNDIAEKILVAGQEYGFVVALQNPYDFEVDIETLKLVGSGVDFTAMEHALVVGPYRTQKFSLAGIAQHAGALTVSGCSIKIKGCRERIFPVFSDPWKPHQEPKMKNVGLKACLGLPQSRPSSTVSTTTQILDPLTAVAPAPMSLTMTVIPEQPVVVISDVSLPQSSLMVLEGEKKRFSITLHNTSPTTAVDFVHISFQDSATAAIQAATSNKDLPSAELHELEVQLAHHPSFQWCKSESDDFISIRPGESASFEIEVVGRARLTDGVIQFDYANLGTRKSDVKDRFFTRQLSVPISVTVNASVQLQRPDVLTLSGDFAWSNKKRDSHETHENGAPVAPASDSDTTFDGDGRFKTMLDGIGIQGSGRDHCMLLLDLRNAWPNPLSISLHVQNASEGILDADQYDAYTVEEVVQPGHINRIMIVLPKFYLKDPYAAIPSLNPANQRQFVVSASKISPEIERASREAFWFREKLLKRIHGTWKEPGNGRHGDIDLRSIRLNARMVEAMKLDDVVVEMNIVHHPEERPGDVRQVGRCRFEVDIDDSLTLRSKVHNRSSTPIHPLLRLQPSLAGLPHNLALDLDKRFSWTGVLQSKLPLLQPGQTVESDLGIVALCSGIFEVSATVEETQIWKEKGSDESVQNRARSGTGLLRGNITGDPTLRAWHAKEPCTIVVRRAGSQ